MNIAMDGPAGAGKSSIAKMVAKRLSIVYIDTGAMYRAMALYFLEHGIDIKKEEIISNECDKIEIELIYKEGEQCILLNGEDVSTKIRKEEVGNVASKVAKNSDVRAKLVDLQRNLAKKENIIMDGRDIGTVVLPNADTKIFLTANTSVRAKRRYDELVNKGIDCDINQIEKDIIARDEQDMNRAVSPLKQAKDAILVDSSNMTKNEVVETILKIVKGDAI